MKLAISNIALPAFEHAALLPRLAELGASGLEVAPSRAWRDTKAVTPAQVAVYRRAVEDAGLAVCGLHSLFFDQPALGLFKAPEVLDETLDFLVHLSSICRDLGGRTLIYGAGRKREGLDPATAMDRCEAFLARLLPRIEPHGTLFCFEPLGPRETDFLNTAAQCRTLAGRMGHPALGIQLDAKALVDNDEAEAATFEAVAGRLDHYHANDPGLVVVGSTATVDHAALGGHLRAIAYEGWVSIEQRMLSEATSLADAAASLAAVRACYGSAP